MDTLTRVLGTRNNGANEGGFMFEGSGFMLMVGMFVLSISIMSFLIFACSDDPQKKRRGGLIISGGDGHHGGGGGGGGGGGRGGGGGGEGGCGGGGGC
ncbi:hypothetical protein ACP275_13G061400 [Erythranthe tilingii]